MSTILDTLVITRAIGATYGAEDLNRVGQAMLYVADRLQACGLAVAVSPKTDWVRTDFPALSEIQRYVLQLRRLYDALTLFLTSPAVPVLGAEKDWLTVQEANDIEKILLDIDTLLTNMARGWVRSGEIFSGEGQQ